MSPSPKQNQYSLKETCSQAILSEGFFLVLRIPPLFLYFFTWREAAVLKIQQAILSCFYLIKCSFSALETPDLRHANKSQA